MKNYIFENKKYVIEKSYFFNIFVNLWLNSRQLTVCICFCLQFVEKCCFGWSKWRKSSLTQYVVGERSNLIVFSDNCEHSSLILWQNLISDSFLKVSCSVESEIISVNFLYVITLKSVVCLLFWMDLLPTHNFVSCVGYLEIVVHWGVQIFCRQYKNPTHLLVSPLSSSEKY